MGGGGGGIDHHEALSKDMSIFLVTVQESYNRFSGSLHNLFSHKIRDI